MGTTNYTSLKRSAHFYDNYQANKNSQIENKVSKQMKRSKLLHSAHLLRISLKEFSLSKKLFQGMCTCSSCCVRPNDRKVNRINTLFDMQVLTILSILITL